MGLVENQKVENSENPLSDRNSSAILLNLAYFDLLKFEPGTNVEMR